ncbi:MAG: hypothetical protein MPW15_26305 [Candidatus Manganitrophus sp.]|nr:hypothetical protein [Candidatus Manganitrophus sp.]
MVPLASFLGGERGESTFLFLKDKPTVEKTADKIGEQVGLPPAEEAVEELLALEETTARDFLSSGSFEKGSGSIMPIFPWSSGR